MSGLLIPDDWSEIADGYCTLSLSVPNSPIWRANARGAIQALTLERAWDAQTGDPTQAAQVGGDIYGSIDFDCPYIPPIWIAIGSLLSYINGIYTIQSALYTGKQTVSVAINHDGNDFLSADLFILNTVSHNFVDSTGNQPSLYDDNYSFIGYGNGDLVDDCFANAVVYYADTGAPVFTVDLDVGVIC